MHLGGTTGGGRRVAHRIFQPGRVNKLVVLSVGHPRAPRTLREDKMAWYQLFFQFEGIAEATLRYDDWAWPVQSRRRRPGTLPARPIPPGAFTASLNWYRALRVIEGASHWIPLDAPDRLNQLLLGWLRVPDTVGQLSVRRPSHLDAHNDLSGTPFEMVVATPHRCLTAVREWLAATPSD